MKQSLTSAYENGSLGISECWDLGPLTGGVFTLRDIGVWPESESFSYRGLRHVPKESVTGNL
ncbi:unnamed protein product [Prunus armeniaca]